MTHPGCTRILSEAHTAELRESAVEARPGRELRDAVTASAGRMRVAVTIRFAGAQDATTLADLAELDSAPPLTLPALVAEVDDELRAALSLSDGRLIADPFHPTVALAELLHTRERQLGERRSGGLLQALRHPLRTARAIRGAVAVSAHP
jgi:hypothetical protein